MSNNWLFSRARHRGATGASAVLLAVAMTVAPAAGSAVAVPPPSPTAEPTMSERSDEHVTLPRMRTWTWMVADADTGAVLAGRDWHWPLPPASTMKTLTALTLAPRLQLDSQYRAQKPDAAAEGSRVGVKAGSRYTVRDLLHGLLMPSGNDAAHALANAFGGMDKATQAMQAEADRLGAKNTVVKNTSGLDEPGQTSSAYDLALFLRESLKNPDLREIYQLHHTDFPAAEPKKEGEPRRSYRIWTENRFVLDYYDGALGGKTGFTSQAGRTYVGAMERDGRRIIVALMRSAENTEQAANRLFEWGFANIDKVQPLDHLAEPGPADSGIVPMPAVNYDESGKPLGAIDPVSNAAGTNRFWLLLGLVLLAAGCVAMWLKRSRERADAETGAPFVAPPLDLREHDRTRT